MGDANGTPPSGRVPCHRAVNLRRSQRRVTMSSLLSETTPGGELEVAFAGELDIAVQQEMRSVLYAAATEQPYPLLVVLLSDVTFIDSTAVATIVHARRHVRELGGDLVLRGVTPGTRQVFEMMGLDDLID